MTNTPATEGSSSISVTIYIYISRGLWCGMCSYINDISLVSCNNDITSRVFDAVVEFISKNSSCNNGCLFIISIILEDQLLTRTEYENPYTPFSEMVKTPSTGL